jgi:hypothetical protein
MFRNHRCAVAKSGRGFGSRDDGRAVAEGGCLTEARASGSRRAGGQVSGEPEAKAGNGLPSALRPGPGGACLRFRVRRPGPGRAASVAPAQV